MHSSSSGVVDGRIWHIGVVGVRLLGRLGNLNMVLARDWNSQI